MGKSLLLADDSVTIQKVVGLSFASEDIEITTVDNGDDALARAREIRPDIILADVVMPGMSGYEVCEAVNADAELRHIPVLLLTGTFEAFDDARAAQAGAAGHVAKPFEAQTLVERVKELLANAPAPEAPAPPAPAEPSISPDATQSVDSQEPAAAPVSNPPSAFDFFDEPADAPPATVAEEPEPEGAFSFETDDLAPAASSTEVPPAAHTIAIMPEELGDPAPPPVPTSLDEASIPEPPASPSSNEGFDFEFESVRSQPTPEAVEPPAATQIAEASLLDPAGDSAFDVSSSDLGDLEFAAPSQPVPPAPPTQLIEPETDVPMETPAPPSRTEGIPSLDADPVMELLSSPQLPEDAHADFVAAAPETAIDPLDMPEPAAEAFAMPEPEPMTDAPLETPEPFGMPEPAIDAFAAAADAPLEADPDLAWPVGPIEAEPVADAQMVSDESIADAAALADVNDIVTEITPVLREQLHETLEKIAWESFGQVTETIVEHAVERLEKAAWEVVPKLAETLILEEIRKLKGE